ncbi:hypothetical protein ACO2Q2_16405 [Dyella sp. KRB-257]|uniref:hypothetical protein n=1 Tax=Dyella sp. KRB-257 TaxID=3400915 RepID=UPI003C0FAB4B
MTREDVDLTEPLLLYVLVPLWLVAGFADWLCHRRACLASTSGPKESLLHLLMFAEVGVPLLAALLLEVNSGWFVLAIVAFFAHEATALWDVSYATRTRWVGPVEQHVHSFLEMIPLMGILLMAVRHSDALLALIGLGTEPAQFALQWKNPPLPPAYLGCLLAAIVWLELLPYMQELWRGLRRYWT